MIKFWLSLAIVAIVIVIASSWVSAAPAPATRVCQSLDCALTPRVYLPLVPLVVEQTRMQLNGRPECQPVGCYASWSW